MKLLNLSMILTSVLSFSLNSQLAAQLPPDAESNWTAAGLWTFTWQANKVFQVNLMTGANDDAKIQEP